MAPRFRWYQPFKNLYISQAWGIYNPAYTQFGFDHHNGVDFVVETGTELLAPFDLRVIQVGNYPNGAGNFVQAVSKDKWSFDDGKEAYVLVEFMHNKVVLAVEGKEYLVGETLALTNNTGFSTGPHTHMYCSRVDANLNQIDTNNANNTFDQMPYNTKIYAGTWIILRQLQLKVAQLMKLFGL